MNKKDLIYYLMIALIIILCIYLFYYIKSESYQCMNSPLTYGVSKFTASRGDFICRCGSSEGLLSILVTRDNISSEKLLDTMDTFDEVNWSAFNISN